MSELIISVSGLRGIVGESLTPHVAVDFCQAFVCGLEPGPVLLARDGRSTGGMLADCIRGGLAAIGRDVIDAGVAATPSAGVLVRSLAAVGGIQVSASHNPPAYNGIKLFGADGQVIDAQQGEQVIERYQDWSAPWVGHEQVGKVTACDDSISRHAELILDTVGVDRIRKCNFRVLLDSNHGAGSRLGKYLLEQLGCDVVSLGDVPDGQFNHPPEPTAENLRDVGQAVIESGAVLGFCQDPDADRLAVIDAAGHYVGEEYTLALCLQHVLGSNPGPIVTNCATSRMARDIAELRDVDFHMAAVGEANVTAVMHQVEAAFGGEGNGGPIDPRIGYVRDSFVGMAQILDSMAKQGKSVAALCADLPRYEIVKTKVAVAREQVPEKLDKLQQHFHNADRNRMDGLRLDWPDRWLLVRASNTEPIVRLIVEARTASEAEAMCQEASAVLREA